MSWQWEQEERGVCKTEKLIEMYEFPDGWMALRKNPFCGGGMLLIAIQLLVLVRGGEPECFLEKSSWSKTRNH